MKFQINIVLFGMNASITFTSFVRGECGLVVICFRSCCLSMSQSVAYKLTIYRVDPSKILELLLNGEEKMYFLMTLPLIILYQDISESTSSLQHGWHAAEHVTAVHICLDFSLNVCSATFSVIGHHSQAFCTAVNLIALYCNSELSIYCAWGTFKKSAILKYFHCVTGNTTEAWSFCTSRSDMWAWFRCSPFVPSERGVKMVAPLRVCTKDKQLATLHFGVWRNERGGDPLEIGCQIWTELFDTMICL